MKHKDKSGFLLIYLLLVISYFCLLHIYGVKLYHSLLTQATVCIFDPFKLYDMLDLMQVLKGHIALGNARFPNGTNGIICFLSN